MELEVGDIVLCTVDRIVGTAVFVKIEGNDEGSIILSEIAPGRIRNLRNYVVPKKKIVCKVLRISGDRIDLSLRRVTQKEKKEVMEQDKQEKSYIKILQSVLKEEAEKSIEEILKEKKIYEFLQEAKENPANLEKIVGKDNSKKILNILKTEKQKKAIIKKEILLTTTKPNGVELIKNILGGINNAEVKYISAGRYALKTDDENLKAADNKLKEIIKDIEKKAKHQGVDFSIKEK
jgi:translation initiation factor 2 alpha subunit (eIF-2alpha)